MTDFLEMILLYLIARRETSGYEIITELDRRDGEVLGYARGVPSIPFSAGLRRQG